MAKKGRRPPDLRDTLGSLMQSALEQVGVVREVVERGAQAQRTRYDTLRLERRRRDALAALGEVVYRRAVRGRLGALDDDPEVRAQLEEIDRLDQRIDAAGERGATGFRAQSGYPRRTPEREEEVRVWRPVPPFTAPEAHPDDELDDDPVEPIEPEDRPTPPMRGGGIRFGDDWDDDDLEQYMHEDDVPEVPPAPTPKPKPQPQPKAKRRKRRKPSRAKGQQK